MTRSRPASHGYETRSSPGEPRDLVPGHVSGPGRRTWPQGLRLTAGVDCGTWSRAMSRDPVAGPGPQGLRLTAGLTPNLVPGHVSGPGRRTWLRAEVDRRG